MFPGLDLYYAAPALPITTAGEELDDLDHDLSDICLSELSRLSTSWSIWSICPRCGTITAPHARQLAREITAGAIASTLFSTAKIAPRYFQNWLVPPRRDALLSKGSSTDQYIWIIVFLLLSNKRTPTTLAILVRVLKKKSYQLCRDTQSQQYIHNRTEYS